MALAAWSRGSISGIADSASVVGVSVAERQGQQVGFQRCSKMDLPVASGILVAVSLYVSCAR